MKLRRSTARLVARAIVACLATAALVGCTTDSTSSAGPSAGASSQPSGPSAIPTDPDATPGGTPPSQTDTDWGRIWDALPDGFADYPGWTPTETGEGPASAFFDAGDQEPAAVMNLVRTDFDLAGLSVGEVEGPREDGSLVLEAVGAVVDACRVRVTATPMGGTTIVEILYGADCPFE
jgi:hypothetical protein